MIDGTPAAPTAVELGYDPWDAAFVADPYPALARLREGPGALYDERDGPVARHPPRGRQRAAPGPAPRPELPPRGDPRGMGPPATPRPTGAFWHSSATG